MSQNSELILKGIMGLDEEAALAFIKRYGMISRVTRRDENWVVCTRDFRRERVNIELDDGLVTRAEVG